MKIEIYTDGSCLGNPGPGGYAAVLYSGSHKKEISGAFRLTTNNRMELSGVIEALKLIKNKGADIRITTDSNYVVKAFNLKWVFGWEKKKWMKGTSEVPNYDLWKELLAEYRKHNVEFVWIEGHSGHPENERCDVLAKAAASKSNLPVDEFYEQKNNPNYVAAFNNIKTKPEPEKPKIVKKEKTAVEQPTEGSELFKLISSLRTEQFNPASENIDIMTTSGILKLINDEDKKVPLAIEKVLPQIETAVDMIVDAFKSGGRLFYFGAGTSGRLGVLDASECPPTFGTEPEMVQASIAGGKEAVFLSREGAEDVGEDALNEFNFKKIVPPDIICGIAASGRTPYVRAAVERAKELGIKTILITTIDHDVAKSHIPADIIIAPDVGPEIIAGSTRLKSGTAQKLVLNMLTTASMVKLGKTYKNIMVDLRLNSKKLEERAKKIVMKIGNVGYEEAEKYLSLSENNVKIAILMILGKISYEEAVQLLKNSNGFIRLALNNYIKENKNEKYENLF